MSLLCKLVIFLCIFSAIGCQTTSNNEDPVYAPVVDPLTEKKEEVNSAPNFVENTIIPEPVNPTPIIPATPIVPTPPIQPTPAPININNTFITAEPIQPVEPVPPTIEEPKPIEIAKPAPVFVEEVKATVEPSVTKVEEYTKKYRIRTVSLPYTPNHKIYAQKLEEHFKKQNIQPVVMKEATSKNGDKFWVVDVGQFNSSNSSDAKDLLNTVRTMKYPYSDFSNAFFVQY